MSRTIDDTLRRLRNPRIPITAFTEDDAVNARIAVRAEETREALLKETFVRGRLYDLLLARGRVEGVARWNDEGKCEVPGFPELIITARTDPATNAAVTLGTGGFATTVSVRMTGVNSGRPLALKISTAVAEGRKESRIMAFLTASVAEASSPHVVRQLFAFECSGGPPRQGAWKSVIDGYITTASEDLEEDLLAEALGVLRGRRGGFFFIGMEEGREDLSRFLMRRPPLPMPLANSLAFQVLQGLATMHAAGVLHRDIQSGNLILVPAAARRRLYRADAATYYEPMESQGVDGPLDAKFIDFGLSAAGNIQNKFVDRAVGLVKYRAPEFAFAETSVRNRRLRRGELRYGPESDVFSAGLIVLALAWKEPIFWVGPDGFIESIFLDPPDALETEVKERQESLEAAPRLSAIDVRALNYTYAGGPTSITYHMWGLVHLLGMPTEADWTGITQDPVYALLNKYRSAMDLRLVDNGGWIRSDAALARLGPRGQSMVRNMLSWDPARRGSAADQLQSGYFALLASRGAVARFVDNLQPVWGPPAEGFDRPPTISCSKRGERLLY